eukprot:4139366-Lingulodinium_polyedra.AAC.1
MGPVPGGCHRGPLSSKAVLPAGLPPLPVPGHLLASGQHPLQHPRTCREACFLGHGCLPLGQGSGRFGPGAAR